MPNHFSIIIDKSVLQGLTQREAEWLFHHFRVNVPPVFFAEILGDLKKEKGFSTSSAEGDVKMLSSKISSAFIELNAESEALVTMELHGRTFPMDGRPVIDRAEPVQMPDGTFGMYIDNTPMQEVLDRWKAGDFEGMEKAFAEVWRNKLATIDLEKIIRSTKGLRDKSMDTPAAVGGAVDSLLRKPNRNYANLLRCMDVLGIPASWRNQIIDRWKRRGRPPADQFIPYTAYVARLELFFLIGVAHHVITTRASNQIDMEYFKYLPFTRVFCSSDRFHVDLFSEFASNRQIFVHGTELKASLQEMADYYDAMPPETKSQGSFTYADYPPVHMDNAVASTYDKIIPNWREGANKPKPPPDPEEDARTMERLKPFMDALEAHRARKGD